MKRFILALVLGAFSTSVQAATVIFDNAILGNAIAILGVEIEGLTYNVTFDDGTFNELFSAEQLTFTSYAESAAASAEMNLWLQDFGTTGIGEGTATNQGHYFIPINVDILGNMTTSGGYYSAPTWKVASGVQGTGRTQNLTYVRFEVVPIPPAFWLFGSALGLLGWMGRRN